MAEFAGAVYLVQIEPHACKCDAPKKTLASSKKLDRAIAVAQGHWNVYLTFYGDLAWWLDIIVIDVRDGVVEWRNGKPLRSNDNGDNESQDHHRGRPVDTRRAPRNLL